MANNFLMRRAGTSDPWTKRIPSSEGTLTGSASFEVKTTGPNNSDSDLTATLNVQLINSSKRLNCILRHNGHKIYDEDPGKQYHFYFRGKADSDSQIFVGIECDGRLLSEINETNQDIADYQPKAPGGSLSRATTIYVDIFSYYLQGTKTSTGEYVFDDTAENRVQVPLSITNLPEWLVIDRISELTNITDGGISNCSCWRITFACSQLTNFNMDDDISPTDPNYKTRFPLDEVVADQRRGVPRTKLIAIQPSESPIGQKEIRFKQYGGYKRSLLFGKQLELNAQELAQASYGYYEVIADNSGSMANYNKSTLSRLPLIDFNRFSWEAPYPTIDFVFKLGSKPTNNIHGQSPYIRGYTYIGYPYILSGLHIINTQTYGDNKYDNLRMGGFYDILTGSSPINTWNYKQSNTVKSKLAISLSDTYVYFFICIISLNDLFSLGHINIPIKETGSSHTLRSPIDADHTIPYINIPNIINGKRSLTEPEYTGYFQWLSQLSESWKSKIHPTTLPDKLLGDSASTFLMVPLINVGGYSDTDFGIGSTGNARLNEWIVVDDTEDDTDANPNQALTSLKWGSCGFTDDMSNVFDMTYDEVLQFRFKLIS